MTLQEKQQNKVKEILFKYLSPNALKLQYDGMTGYELAGIILREAESVEHEEMARDIMEQERAGDGDV